MWYKGILRCFSGQQVVGYEQTLSTLPDILVLYALLPQVH
jgi:hypothetical protein